MLQLLMIVVYGDWMCRWELYVLRNIFFVPPHIISVEKKNEDNGRSERALKRQKLVREIQQVSLSSNSLI